MLIQALAILGGVILLTWSADRFVAGAASIARNLGVPPLIVGLTVVGFGTSAPELMVSVTAAWQGTPRVAIGNAIGSNITNLTLILGATAVVTPLRVRSEMLRRELPLLLAAMLLALVTMLDGQLGRVDGIVLLGGLVLVLYWLTALALRARRRDPIVAEYEAGLGRAMSTKAALAWTAAGLLLLLLSSEMLVFGAVGLAKALGISDLVVGLTIVAVGTSLPELAASMASARRQEHDIAVGNVIGSNIFNILGVLGLPAVLAPAPVPPEVMTRDFPVMIGLTLAVFVMAQGFRHPGRITRLQGVVLLGAFAAYEVYLYAAA